jgi:uncharacterized protein (DUF1499 family)
MKTKNLILLACALMLLHCTGTKNMKLGVSNGKLLPCPASSNCVCSQSAVEDHYIEPLTYDGTANEAKRKLVAVIHSMERAKIAKETDDYIHAEFTSALLRFVDDVEFYFPADERVIQVRSASRVGYYDFGVNRKRLEKIRSEFTK